jgi:signal transduction histidine kinase
LALFKGDQLYPVFLADTTLFRGVLGIVETAAGDLWLCESRGLIYIPSSEVRKVLDEPSSRIIEYRVFDSLDGLPGAFRDDQTFPTEIQATDGHIWFVTTNGIAWIDPKNIRKNLLPPPVVIRSVSANGKQYSSWVNLKLPALTRDLHIGYAGLSLSIPERVRYRYKLEGADKDWQDPGTRREAIYNSLPPGSYRFRVIACNNDGVWNEEGATLDFTISAAWYQTRLFFTCCVLAGGLLIWVLYRIRMRQMARQLKLRFDEIVAERTRIARDLHDTLVQTIQGSKMVVEDGLKASADPDRMHHALERSSLFLEQATQEARAALNSLRLSAVETNDLADAFGRALEDCRRQGNVDVSLSVLGHKKDLHPVVRDEVYRIGYEAIRNACRHSHGSRLNVELIYSQDLTLRVADNGVGIDPMSAERGREGHYGIQGMRERAERIAAKLTIMSTTGSGTQVTVLVPGRIIFR